MNLVIDVIFGHLEKKTVDTTFLLNMLILPTSNEVHIKVLGIVENAKYFRANRDTMGRRSCSNFAKD